MPRKPLLLFLELNDESMGSHWDKKLGNIRVFADELEKYFNEHNKPKRKYCLWIRTPTELADKEPRNFKEANLDIDPYEIPTLAQTIDEMWDIVANTLIPWDWYH